MYADVLIISLLPCHTPTNCYLTCEIYDKLVPVIQILRKNCGQGKLKKKCAFAVKIPALVRVLFVKHCYLLLCTQLLKIKSRKTWNEVLSSI